jgi:hypothetical protein
MNGNCTDASPFTPIPCLSKEASMGKGKMSGDNSAESKGHPGDAPRGSGGTTKKRLNPGYQDNNKAANTKSNRQ